MASTLLTTTAGSSGATLLGGRGGIAREGREGGIEVGREEE